MTNFPLEFLRSRLARRLASRDNSPSPQRHRRRHCKTRTKYTDSIHDDPAPTFSYSGQCGPLRRIRQHLVPLDMPFVPVPCGRSLGRTRPSLVSLLIVSLGGLEGVLFATVAAVADVCNPTVTCPANGTDIIYVDF